MNIREELRKQLLVYQRNEITEHHIYKRLAKAIEAPENKRILEKLPMTNSDTIESGRLIRNRKWSLTD